MPQLPFDKSQERAEAGKEPDTSSQAVYNQRQNEEEASDESTARTRNRETAEQTGGRAGRDQQETGRMKNETAVRHQEDLREGRDKGYGSEYIGDEYKDVKVEPDDEAA